ncbi:unnamed protein product [Alopecurus aequalis]
MAISDTSGVRHVRCPKCHSVLQEPTGVPVYQCGGCGTSLRAKIRAGDAQDAAVGAAPSSESVLPSPRLGQSGRFGFDDVASTSAPASTPGAPATVRHQGAGTTGRSVTGDLTPGWKHPAFVQEQPIVDDDHRSADRSEADGSSGRHGGRGAVSAPNRDAAAGTQDSARRREAEPEIDAAGKNGSGKASAAEAAPISARAADTRSAPAAVSWKRRDDVTAAALAVVAEEKAASPPPRQAPQSVENKGRGHRSADQEEAAGSSGRHRGRGAVSAPGAAAEFTERRREVQHEPADATTKGGSDEAARSRSRDLGEAAPISAPAVDSRSAPAAAPAVAEEKAASPPPQHALSPHKMSPLHEKILKTVDELKDDLSELFSKSPELKPRTPPRTPRHPTQEAHASRPAIPTGRARHAAAAAALHRRGNAGYAADKHGQAAPRGLPSRRYRRCRADSCGSHDARPAGPCRRHSCCDHGKPECGSCRGHCCRSSRAQEPARHAAVEAKRRAAPPKQHCRPVLKGAPFIVCSNCFKLVQVPAGFAVPSARVRDLRCGACSAVLSYSYRDPERKKPVDAHGAVGSSPARHVGARPDLFSFIEDFAGGVSSYSTTEDERPLHVSRNSSFDTVVAAEETGPLLQRNSLHRLMGYGSARELLLRRSPSLYEFGSFDKRSTPPSDASRRHVDRKGKAVCLDTDDDVAGDDDSEDSCPLRRSGPGWAHGKGVPAPGAIRIRS